IAPVIDQLSFESLASSPAALTNFDSELTQIPLATSAEFLNQCIFHRSIRANLTYRPIRGHSCPNSAVSPSPLPPCPPVKNPAARNHGQAKESWPLDFLPPCFCHSFGSHAPAQNHCTKSPAYKTEQNGTLITKMERPFHPLRSQILDPRSGGNHPTTHPLFIPMQLPSMSLPSIPYFHATPKTGNFCTSVLQKKLDASQSTTCIKKKSRIPVSCPLLRHRPLRLGVFAFNPKWYKTVRILPKSAHPSVAVCTEFALPHPGNCTVNDRVAHHQLLTKTRQCKKNAIFITRPNIRANKMVRERHQIHAPAQHASASGLWHRNGTNQHNFTGNRYCFSL
ncbi:MAG: hypothetical protein JWM16_3254, partial [Verrucomicrobiales bacterium]|nr:hypothetical protein [Verrucomicrobiales bacterium]